MKKLTQSQKVKIKTMCVAVFGLGKSPKSVTELKDNSPWLELCATTLFERIVGYNAQKMQDMMYPYMLGTQHPIDFLYKEYLTKDLSWINRK